MSEDGTVILCGDCGAKNLFPADFDGALACMSCGRSLATRVQPVPRIVSGASSPAMRRGDPAGSKLALAVVAAGLAIGAVVGAFVFTLEQGGNTAVATAGRPEVVETLKPVSQTPGLVFNRTGRNGEGPFKIVTLPGSNYFLKLVNRETGQDAIGIYVVGGRTVEVKVPPGHYELRYAAGETWYGEEYMFGAETRFAASLEDFAFRRDEGGASGHIVELFNQPNGNLEMHDIGAGDF